MRYTLKDVGLPYKHIMLGKKQVGRVFRKADGTYGGVIGPKTITAHSEDAAFRAVCLNDMEQTEASYRQKQEQIRQHNARVRQTARAAGVALAERRYDDFCDILFGGAK